MLDRASRSHKGENGKVLIIGGNEVFHGAPILAALGAEKSGVDLTYLLVPKSQRNLARNYSANVIVDTFESEKLSDEDLQKALDWSNRADVCVVGNGLGSEVASINVVRELLNTSQCQKFVLDAGAVTFGVFDGLDLFVKEVVLTPHRGELAKLKTVNEKVNNADLFRFSEDSRFTIVLTGAEDMIVSFGGRLHINKTGHPIMTKGGTGDVLAGLIGGLMAQGLDGFDAAKEATRVWGEVGESVYNKKGLMVTVEELLMAY